MKNRFRFIVPKLIGVTLIAGILSFLMVAIFKILALLTVTFVIGAVVLSRIRKKHTYRRDRAASFAMQRPAVSVDMRTGSMGGPIPVGIMPPKAAIIPIH